MYSSLLKAASDATARRRLAEQQRMRAGVCNQASCRATGD
jgi:hypothetical protein